MSWRNVQFDWNCAKAFLTTVESGSLSSAAKVLNLTQPTVGRQVAALEQQLGVTLFERMGQKLVLTAIGSQLIKQVQVMGEAAQQFTMQAEGQSQDLKGCVTVSVSEVEALFMLPKAIEQIRSLYPQIYIDLHVSNEVANLKRREADIAIRSFRPEQGDLITKKLREDNIWLYGTSKYLGQFSNIKQAQDIRHMNVIGFENSPQLIELLNSIGINLNSDNQTFSSLSQMMQLQMVKRHLGVALFPEFIEQTETEITKAFEFLGPVMKLPLWLVSHRELHTSLRVRKVFDILASHLSST